MELGLFFYQFNITIKETQKLHIDDTLTFLTIETKEDFVLGIKLFLITFQIYHQL